jgi:hypothetical protein
MIFQITGRTKRVVAAVLVTGIVAAGVSGAVSGASGGGQPTAPPQTQTR